MGEVLTNVPNGTTVYTYTPGVGFSGGATFTQGSGWFDNDFPGGTGGPTNGPALVPGEGAFIVPRNATNFTITFNGTTNVPVLPLSLNCGLAYFVNRQTVGIGTFENITGQAPLDGAQVFIPSSNLPFGEAPDREAPNYAVYTFCGGGWLPIPPNVPVGQSVFVSQPCQSNVNANAMPCLTVQQSNILLTSTSPVAVDFAPTAKDNCNADASIVTYCRPPSGSIFMPGTTSVHCVALDNLGNAASCDFTVTLAPPVIPVPILTNQIVVHPGLNLIAYQFNNGGNTLREILTNVPDGTVVSKYVNSTSSWLQSTYNAGLGAWVPGNITLRPGEGAFLNNPGRASINLTFTGNPNLPVLPVPITNGITLLSRQTNDIGTYLNITGTNPAAGDEVFQWNGEGYNKFAFDGTNWSPNEPSNAVGEAWWIAPRAAFAPFGIAPPPIPVPPVITEEPTNVVDLLNSDGNGEDVTFSVTAVCDQPLQYQWRLNGNPLPGATNDTLTIFRVRPVSGGNYDVLVQNTIGIAQSTVATLTFANVPNLPFADNFAAAGAIPGIGTGIGSNVGATVENGEPSPGFIPGGASVWVTWMAPATGVATFRTTGSGFDTLLAIYTGTTLTGLTPVAFDDDSGGSLCSLTSFNAVGGTKYYVQVDGFYGATGNIVLSWSLNATSNTLPVIVTPPRSQTVGFGGSAQFSVAVQAGSSVSYQWQRNGVRIPGATSNNLNFANIGVPQVGVYQVQIFNNNGGLSTLSFPAELQINTGDLGLVNADSRAESKLQALMDTTVRPNDPYDPPIVTGYSGVEVFSSYGSTVEPAEPLHCGVTCYYTKWHSYMAPANGLLYVANAGTTFAGVLGVYSGPDFSLVPLACSGGHAAGNEVVSFQTTSNTTYWISMSGTNANTSGTVQLQYATYTPPLYTLLPMTQTDTAGSNVVLSVATIGNPAVSYQWQVNGTNITGATSATLALNNFSGANEGNYTVYAMNIAGTNFFSLAPVFLNNPPRFVNFASAPGVMFAQFLGIANSNYLFQSSSDNVHWVTTSSGSSPSGVMNFSAPVNTNSPALFYRGVLPAPIP